MAKDVKVCSKVARGQVWMVNGDDNSWKTGSVGSVTGKTRPYVIVSCKENNLHSTTFNAVAVSTGTDDYYPMHVGYKYNGKPQIVQCEQIKTFDIIDLKDYMYTLSDDIMTEVDIALANQLELSLRIPSYDRLVELIEKIAKAKASEFNAKYQNVTDDAIQEIASRLEAVFKVDESAIDKYADTLADKVELPSANVTLKKATEINPVKNVQRSNTSVASGRTGSNNAYVVKTDNLNNTEPTVNTKDVKPAHEYTEVKRTPISQIPTGAGRNKWTEENKQKFLEDCDKYGPETVAQMWGLKDKRAVYSYKYMFKGADQ